VTIDRVATPEGDLELRRRAADDFLMCVGGRVLMSSAARRSEEALGELAEEALRISDAPRILIAGLGMGHTLRSALDRLPEAARVEVAELNPVVLRWCRTELAEQNGSAVLDTRVSVEIADVAQIIRAAATAEASNRYHAILLDLYEGPAAAPTQSDPFYGRQALESAHAALAPGGVLGVWSEEAAPGFERGMRHAGFDLERRRAGRGGRRHVIYLARRR
jgi:spermidine synthase